ncbi:MAG: winged helix-turn-helix transcriptional regulator [Candidatus Nanoarchaeia archaeon]
MSKNNFLLLSLEDDKINNVANAVSNKSGKKILDFLAEGKATESEIAKKLNLAISTVHYNLQQLMKAGLVVADEYHYSEKGREILHYKLANKYIIIAPQKKRGLKKLLKNILPVVLISAGVAGILEFFTRNFTTDATNEVAQESAPKMMTAETEAAASNTLLEEVGKYIISDIAIWFFLGAIFASILYLIIQYLRKN